MMAKKPTTSSDLPEGTVTFLFTDIEGSTELLKALGDRYSELLEDQRRIVRACFEKWDGTEVDTQGDSFFISFPRATQAVSATVEIQRKIQNHTWPEDAEVRLRMGLHTGEPLTWAEGYVGMDVHRAARIAQVGHGGQVLLSETTTALIRGELPEGVSLQDLGTHVLKDISQPEQIHQLAIAGFPSDFPALTSLESRPNNLPVQPTPFVGRVDELIALDGLIADPHNRLISILGPGGMGKTRLAIAAAEQQLHTLISSNGEEAPRFPDGAFFVGLAPLETTEAIVPTVGKALGLQFYEGTNPRKQTLDYLRRKRMLLLMDNFEHLTDGAALLADIVQAAPEVKLLVTSRERLNLESEVPYHLKGMRFPEEGDAQATEEPFSAVALFLQRASRVNPDFIPDDKGWQSIGRICRLVEGVPLGVELAAAWMELLSPAEIASEIQKGLDFLEAEKIDVPERHRSIRAVFDTTWGRMGEEEREILKAISVFRGGFTLEAARDVVGASNKQMLKLVNRSLLQRVSADRFAIHELLRQYAEERLGQDPSVKEKLRDIHCEYFTRYLHENEAAIDGGDTAQALEDIDNIRVAWQWAVSRGKIPEIKKQLWSLNVLYDFQGWYQEAETTLKWAADTLYQVEPDAERGVVYASIVVELGFHSYRADKRATGMDLIREGRKILRQLGARMELAFADMNFGFLCEQKDYPEAKQTILEDLAYLEGKNEPLLEAYLLNTLGNINFFQGNYAESEKYFRKGLEIGKSLQNRRSIAWSTWGLGSIARSKGDYKEAIRCIKQVFELFGSIGYKNMAGNALSGLGDTLNMMGEHEAAREQYEKALAIHEAIGKQEGIAYAIYGLGDSAYGMGHYGEAREYFEQALTLFRTMDEPDELASGMLTIDMGKVAFALNNANEAQEKLKEALEIGHRHQNEPLSLRVLEGVASLHSLRGDIERAIQLVSLVINHPRCGDFPRVDAKKQLADLEGQLPKDEVDAAQERGKALDLWTTVDQTLTELRD